MARQLTESVSHQLVIALQNLKIAIDTCELEHVLSGAPLWEHAYHTLHLFDEWFIHPSTDSDEPSFHRQGHASSNRGSRQPISRDDLLATLDTLQLNLLEFLDDMTDSFLIEKPKGRGQSRLALVYEKIRQLNLRIGSINATTIAATGQWPLMLDLEDLVVNTLYD